MKLAEQIAKHYGLSADSVGVKVSLSGINDDVGNAGDFIATSNTAAIDGDDEVVLPDGCEVDGAGNPVYFNDARAIYLNHDYSAMPVGTMRRNRLVKGHGWKTQFYITDKTEVGRDVRALIGEGVIRGTSIGFIAKQHSAPDDDEVAKYGPAKSVVRRWKWLELSVTAMPCNPEAWIDGPTLDDDSAKALEKMMRKGWVHRKTADALGWRSPRKTIVLPRPKTIILD
jgi:HK97 family phage prohead protease